MAKINHLGIYSRLNKSNCRDCGIHTCMAFALSVISGDKDIFDCPHLDREVAGEMAGKIVTRDRDKDIEMTIGPLRQALADIDFDAVAEGLGAELIDEKLRINCLGKDFFIDRKGNLESAVHVNEWIMLPLLKYIKTGGSAGLDRQMDFF